MIRIKRHLEDEIIATGKFDKRAANILSTTITATFEWMDDEEQANGIIDYMMRYVKEMPNAEGVLLSLFSHMAHLYSGEMMRANTYEQRIKEGVKKSPVTKAKTAGRGKR